MLLVPICGMNMPRLVLTAVLQAGCRDSLAARSSVAGLVRLQGPGSPAASVAGSRSAASFGASASREPAPTGLEEGLRPRPMPGRPSVQALSSAPAAALVSISISGIIYVRSCLDSCCRLLLYCCAMSGVGCCLIPLECSALARRPHKLRQALLQPQRPGQAARAGKRRPPWLLPRLASLAGLPAGCQTGVCGCNQQM